LAGLGGIAKIEPDLAEWDYGDYEGLHSAEIVEKRPGWDIFTDGCPNGETPDQVAARADRLLGRLEALDGNVVVFSHSHFSRVLGVRWIGLPVVQGQHFALDTGSLSILESDHHHAGVRIIALWNAMPV
jgi:broad specificity phosphatase PhoE